MKKGAKTTNKATTSKTTTKPAATKTASKPAATKKQDTKKTSNTHKNHEKKEDTTIDKRAFVSGESTKKVQNTEIIRKSNMKCVKTIQAHEDWVEKIIMLSNGKIITTSQDGSIKSWNLLNNASNKPLSCCEGHSEAVMDVIEFGKDKIVSVSKDKTVHKWNVSTGKELYCYKIDQPVYCIKKINDSLIAVGGADKSIRVLDFSLDTNKEEDLPKIEVARLEGHNDEITALEIGNNMLISSSMDKTIILWNLTKYTLVKKLEGHTEGVKCLKMLKNGNLASGSFDNTIKVWDLSKYTCIQTLKGHTGHIFALNQLPDGRIISGASDWSIIVWNENGSQDFVLEGHEEAVYTIEVLPDGKVVSGSVDQNIKLWD